MLEKEGTEHICDDGASVTDLKESPFPGGEQGPSTQGIP